MARKLSNKELADLPENWQNASVDTSKYIPCAIEAYEVTHEEYLECKRQGVMVQKTGFGLFTRYYAGA